MPLANRVLVRYAAEALIASGVTDVGIAVSASTVVEVGELLGDGSRFGARFPYLELPESGLVARTPEGCARRSSGEHPLIVHSGDALVAGERRSAAAVAEFTRAGADVLLVAEPTHCLSRGRSGRRRGRDRDDDRQLTGSTTWPRRQSCPPRRFVNSTRSSQTHRRWEARWRRWPSQESTVREPRI